MTEARSLTVGDTIILPFEVVMFPSDRTVQATITFINPGPGTCTLILGLNASDHLAYTVQVSETEKVEQLTKSGKK